MQLLAQNACVTHCRNQGSSSSSRHATTDYALLWIIVACSL